MTPEQLEMLKKLKAPIDKYMGEIISGDWIVSPYTGEPFCIGANGQLGFDKCIRIPPLCTPDGKRCLWGMITNVEWKLLINRPTKEDGLQCRYSDNLKEIYADDPYTALLKALCAQEGL